MKVTRQIKKMQKSLELLGCVLSDLYVIDSKQSVDSVVNKKSKKRGRKSKSKGK